MISSIQLWRFAQASVSEAVLSPTTLPPLECEGVRVGHLRGLSDNALSIREVRKWLSSSVSLAICQFVGIGSALVEAPVVRSRLGNEEPKTT
jgi:hypothetical protein